MIAKKNILGLLFTLITITSFSQNLVWYFGSTLNTDPITGGWVTSSFGLDFTTGDPVQRNKEGVLKYYESVSVVSDENGNVLYYTDGIKVYDASHTLMSGMPGVGYIKGTQHGTTTASSVQGAFSLLKPGSLTEYYLFTSNSVEGSSGFSMHRIDMSLQGNGLSPSAPLGELVTTDSLLHSSSSEMMTAYGVCGSDSVWIITHERGTYNFVRTLVTTNGVQSVDTEPIPTPAALTGQGWPSSAEPRGAMDINKDGTKLVFTGANPIGTWLLDFDKSTGKVSNPLELLDPNGDAFSGYGCEFSPDDSKMLCS